MSRFDLLYDMKNEFERTVGPRDLISALFHDHPELENFDVSVTSEYDDNNYSDYCRVTKVNGWYVDYDGEFEEEFDDQDPHEFPKPSKKAIENCMGVAEYVKSDWGYGDHTFFRKMFSKCRDMKEIVENPNLACIMAIAKGGEVPLNTLLEADQRWIVKYADVHGRYSDEDEFALFAREDMICSARNYAFAHGPLTEKTLNYFLLSLNAEEHDYRILQEYMEWLKAKAA